MQAVPVASRSAITRKACLRCGARFAWTNLAVACTMVTIKVGVGILAGSQALIASALYSVNDLLAAIAVLASLKLGSRPPDAEHPFGHGKIEFVAIGMVSIVLTASVLMAAYSAFDLVEGTEGPPEAVALLVAILSIGVSILMSQKGHCAATRLGSPALHTSADHSHADAVASVAVAVGLTGALLGLHWLDRVVAIIETFDIMRLSGRLLGRAFRGLMDTALPRAQVEAVREACERVEGVLRVTALRTRRSGSETWVDLVVLVEDDRTVEQADAITQRVHEAVRATLGPTARPQVAYRSGTGLGQTEAVSHA
jgi:cation diffusion facilitator family transporter